MQEQLKSDNIQFGIVGLGLIGGSIAKSLKVNNFDVYVHLTKHQFFKELNVPYKKNSLIFDLNHTLNIKKRLEILKNKNYESYFIGSK